MIDSVEVPEAGLPKVGVIGAGGNLGARWVAQLMLTGHEVFAYESEQDLKKRLIEDRNMRSVFPGDNQWYERSLLSDKGVLNVVEGPQDVIESVDIVHFTVPGRVLHDMPAIDSNPDRVGVAHDSVMALSRNGVSRRKDNSQFSIVHFLMNENGRVNVSPDHGDTRKVHMHLKNAGMDPVEKTVEEADEEGVLQSVFALLIEAGLKDQAEQLFSEGGLTPSATELLGAFRDRESEWTRGTMSSLLSNPSLADMIVRLQKALSDRSGSLGTQ